jgi:hypothetical protein
MSRTLTPPECGDEIARRMPVWSLGGRRMLDLHSRGWRARELADELKIAGVMVSPARLRECLGYWASAGDGTARSRPPRRSKRTTANTQPTIMAGHSERGNEAQTGQRATTR